MSGIPDWMPFPALIGAIVMVVLIAYMVFRLAQKVHRKLYAQVAEDAILILAYLYAFGAFLKISGQGPEIIRYYLGDFGFSATIVVLVSAVFLQSRLKYDDRSTYEKLYQSEKNYVKARMKLVPMAFGFCVLFEIFAGLVNADPDAPTSYVADFDWIDIGVYVLGASALAGLLLWKLKLLNSAIEDIRTYEAAKSTVQSLQPKPSAPKRYHKKKIKRGVR